MLSLIYLKNARKNIMNKEIRSAERSFNGFKVKYVLYKRKERSFDDGEARPCYSVCVEKSDGKGTDRAYADDISSLETEALYLFDLIVKHGITPISLWDIIEDNMY